MSRFTPVERPSTFRKIAAAMWRQPRDPTIYGALDLDATALLSFVRDFRAARGIKLTITHVVASAVARAIAAHPEVNAKVHLWGQLEQRDTVDVFLQVAVDGDLAGARIDRADQKTLGEIAAELTRQAEKIRAGKDENYDKSRGLFQRLPWWAVRPVLAAADLLTNELHVDLPAQGLPRDPFGSAMITNVGSFGIDTAFAPFTPIARCPILVLVPQVRERPWAVQGTVCARPILRLCATFDHRVIDGQHAGKLSRTVGELLEHPERLPA